MKNPTFHQFLESAVKVVLYHGTHGGFSGFDPDFDYENVPSHMGQVRDYEVPDGMVFLTDSPEAASFYGSKVVTVELTASRVYVANVGNQPPAVAFDDDYNGDQKIWSKFVRGGYDALQVVGKNRSGKTYSIYLASPGQLKVL